MRNATDKTNKKIDDLAAGARKVVTRAGGAAQSAAKTAAAKLREVAGETGKRIEDVGRRVGPSPAIPDPGKRRGAGRRFSVSPR